MKEQKIIKRMEKAIKSHQICDVYLEYTGEEPCKFMPVKMSEKLFMAVKDGDITGNGYTIRSMEDVTKVKVKDSGTGTPADTQTVEQEMIDAIDLTDWVSALSSLAELNKVVVVEQERQKKDVGYAIGRIVKIGKKNLGVKYYGPDRAWADKKWKVPYSEITRVTVGSRYAEVLTGYVPEAGEEEVFAFAEENGEEM